MNDGDSFLAQLDLLSHSFWYIPIIVNILLLAWDYSIIKESSIDISSLKKIIILVPVYLYKRAMLFKDNLLYFIIWLVCFFIMLVI